MSASDSSEFEENAPDWDKEEKGVIERKKECDHKLPLAFKLKRHPCHCVCLPTSPHVVVADHKGVISVLHYDSYVESSSKSQDPNKSQLPQVSLKCVEKAHNSFFYLDSNASSTQLVSGGDGRSIVLSDIETGLKPVVRISKAHGSSISAVCWYNDSCVVTGDTRGRIKAFDVRMGNSGKRRRVFKFYEHEGEMTDFSGDSARRLLFASSTDSTMSTIDFRRTQYKMQSQPSSNGEMRSVLVMGEQESKVVCGLSDGHVQIYQKGYYGVHTESLPIFDQMPNGRADLNLDKMRAIGDNVYAVSDDNGHIFAYSLFPNRRLTKVGCHRLATECFDLDYSGNVLISCGADKLLKFWDVSVLAASEILEQRSKQTTKQQILAIRKCFDPAAAFFADLHDSNGA